MTLRTLLIDDDADSRQVTRTLIEQYCPAVSIIAEAASVGEGVNLVAALRPELLLLDIILPDGTGFDLLNRIPVKNFEVIFLTAHEAFAIEAFKFSAVDYLLKPVSIDHLKDAISRASERVEKKMFESHWITLSYNLLHHNNYDRKIALHTANGYVFKDVKNIAHCQSKGNYTEFHFSNEIKMTSSKNLGFYEELLPPDKFYRIHHSHLVNIDFVEKYIKGVHGGSIILKDGTELDVSQRKKDDFLHKVLSKQ